MSAEALRQCGLDHRDPASGVHDLRLDLPSQSVAVILNVAATGWEFSAVEAVSSSIGVATGRTCFAVAVLFLAGSVRGLCGGNVGHLVLVNC